MGAKTFFHRKCLWTCNTCPSQKGQLGAVLRGHVDSSGVSVLMRNGEASWALLLMVKLSGSNHHFFHICSKTQQTEIPSTSFLTSSLLTFCLVQHMNTWWQKGELTTWWPIAPKLLDFEIELLATYPTDCEPPGKRNGTIIFLVETPTAYRSRAFEQVAANKPYYAHHVEHKKPWICFFENPSSSIWSRDTIIFFKNFNLSYLGF